MQENMSILVHNMEGKAIKAALKRDWKKAIKINKQILKEKKKDIEALNRLAYAYTKILKYEKAKRIYQKLLRLEPFNPIARKNLAKLKSDKNLKKNKQSSAPISPNLFLLESEKEKSVNLINIAPKNILQGLLIGEEVKAYKKGFELQVKTKDGVYLGTFPDDAGRTLINLLKKKVKLHFFLKDIQENLLKVFVKWQVN